MLPIQTPLVKVPVFVGLIVTLLKLFELRIMISSINHPSVVLAMESTVSKRNLKRMVEPENCVRATEFENHAPPVELVNPPTLFLDASVAYVRPLLVDTSRKAW